MYFFKDIWKSIRKKQNNEHILVGLNTWLNKQCVVCTLTSCNISSLAKKFLVFPTVIYLYLGLSLHCCLPLPSCLLVSLLPYAHSNPSIWFPVPPRQPALPPPLQQKKKKITVLGPTEIQTPGRGTSFVTGN